MRTQRTFTRTVMSASYTDTRTVQDTNAFLSYISKTLPTVISVSNTGGVSVIITFSSALTAAQQTLLTALVAAYIDVATGVVDSVNLSVYNSTTAPLAPSGNFTGGWDDVSRYGSLSITVLSSAASIGSGFKVQFGILSQQADISRSFSIAAATAFTVTTAVQGRFFRVVYTNGAVAQTSFSLQTKWIVFGATYITDGITPANDLTQTQMVRSVMTGRQDNNSYIASRVDEERRLRFRQAIDNALTLPTPIAVAQLNFSNIINADTTASTVTGGGTVTSANGCAVVTSSTIANSSATLTSRRFVTVGAARVVRVFVATSFAAAAAGSNQLIGVGTSEAGFFVGYNGTAFAISIRSGSTDSFTVQSAFNVDPLNGSGPSGLTLVPTNGNSFMICYDTSGYGSVSFSLCSTNTSENLVFHRATLNTTSTPVLRTYSFPLMATVINSTNNTSLSMRVASMAALVNSPPIRIGSLRSADVTKTITSLVYVPIMSITNSVTLNSLPNTGSLIVKSIGTSAEGQGGSVVIALFDNTSLANPMFGSVSAANSSAQIDTTATAMTGGVQTVTFPLNKLASTTFDLTPFDICCAPGQTLTIAAKCSAALSTSALSISLMFVSDC